MENDIIITRLFSEVNSQVSSQKKHNKQFTTLLVKVYTRSMDIESHNTHHKVTFDPLVCKSTSQPFWVVDFKDFQFIFSKKSQHAICREAS
jgi:hypothetical protein